MSAATAEENALAVAWAREPRAAPALAPPADGCARSRRAAARHRRRVRRRLPGPSAATGHCCSTRATPGARGRALSRAELREFAGGLDDQLVMWELFAEGGGTVELALDDLGARRRRAGGRERGRGRGRSESRVASGRSSPTGARPSSSPLGVRPCAICATCSSRRPVAWCTGERAGLGRLPAPGRRCCGGSASRRNGDLAAPRCLVVTDVAAEGLDLRRADRVVHYDLPGRRCGWSSARGAPYDSAPRTSGSRW